MTLVTGGSEYEGAVLADIQRELGITLTAEDMPFEEYSDRLDTRHAPDVEPRLERRLSASQRLPGPAARDRQPQQPRRLERSRVRCRPGRGRVHRDAAEQEARYADAQRIVQDQVPVIPLQYGETWALSRDGLLGASQSGMGIVRYAGLEWATPMSRRSTRRTNTGVRILMAIVVVTMILGMILAGASARGQSPRSAAAHFAGQPAAAVRAGQPSTSTQPTATGSLTKPITFSTTFRSAETPDRVELLSRLKDGDTDLVRTVEPTRQPDGSYAVELVQGGFTPANSTLDFRFRVTTPSGTRDRADRAPSPSPMTGSTGAPCPGPTVTLHWYEGDDAFAQRALTRSARTPSTRPRRSLGVTEVKPVDFFIYSTEEAFRGALAPERSRACRRAGQSGHPDDGRQHRRGPGRFGLGGHARDP